MWKIDLKELDFLVSNLSLSSDYRSFARGRTVIALILSIPTLSGCQIGAKVAVNYVDGIPVFTVTREDGGETCVGSISVREGTHDVNGSYLWAINQNYADVQSGKAKCQSTFTYGKVTIGFESQLATKPLIPGKTYRVEIGGGGLTGGADFNAR
jgi:hypothetical protein